MGIGEYISAGRDVLVGLSAACAAIFAYLGLSAWRRELKGKSEYQLAKSVLKSVYKVREAFKRVRNPAIYEFEYPKEMTDNRGHLKPEHQYEGTAYVYENRWKNMAESFGELEGHHLDAQVEWGPEFQHVIEKLRLCSVELQIAIQRMLERIKSPHDHPMTSIDEKAEERSILYYLGSDSKHDKFTPQIEEAIGEFERWLRPYIKRR